MLLDFWATWCPPCRVEIPHLVEAYKRYHDRGFEIIGVTLDQGPAASVERFLADRKMTWEQIHDNAQSIAVSYGVSAIPAAFLVDGDTGTTLAAGDDLRGDALFKTIEKHLKPAGH